MSVFTSHRIAHSLFRVWIQWLLLQKYSQMMGWRVSWKNCVHWPFQTSCVIFAVSVHRSQSTLRHGALYSEFFIRLHAACCHPPECHSLLLWIPQSCWHGEYNSGLLRLFCKWHVVWNCCDFAAPVMLLELQNLQSLPCTVTPWTFCYFLSVKCEFSHLLMIRKYWLHSWRSEM